MFAPKEPTVDGLVSKKGPLRGLGPARRQLRGENV